MNITTPQINSHSAANPYAQQNEQIDQQITSPDVINQEGATFQEEMRVKEKFQLEPRGDSVLNRKEKATLHALFGTEKPSETIFYGRTQIQHIHKGQLLNIKG